jgi:SAM-dependent methyltransferase
VSPVTETIDAAPAPAAAAPARTWRRDLKSALDLFALVDIVTPCAVRLAADLGVADQLLDGARTVEALATATGTDAPSLYRLLRALACRGVFAETSPGTFALTPMAALLCSDHPLRLRGAFTVLPSEIRTLNSLEWGIRTGGAPFDHAHGMPFWDYLEAHPDEAARFDHTQEAMTQIELLGVVRAYPWREVGVVADIGGGNGAFLAGLLSHFEAMRGLLYDLPHSIANAAETLARANVAARCEVRAGDFYAQVPSGADVYVVKRVLWGHRDAGALQLLANVRAAMREGGRLVIIEPVLEPAAAGTAGWSGALGALHDVRLLMFGHGRARTRDQIAELLHRAGLRLLRVVPAFVTSVVEAAPE